MFGRVVGSGGASPVWSDDYASRDEPRVVERGRGVSRPDPTTKLLPGNAWSGRFQGLVQNLTNGHIVAKFPMTSQPTRRSIEHRYSTGAYT